MIKVFKNKPILLKQLLHNIKIFYSSKKDDKAHYDKSLNVNIFIPKNF